ncbi:uncharacterized protein BKCO1_19000141 [Diplodia corticola]|uniref:Uncharacterized protein n=1 Tax=Diplodia corticola TaxID=236234 RepID=A0A1J9R3F4_9PEZI|nr:uncharacterized protein BKCO1_19000141 [Diplodia corticola]OJD35113.1 hypothetical protein BKCO1_19000141 [Diplodia corticola]
MSDKESDGPQKSHVDKSKNPKELNPEFEKGDEVTMATGINGKPEKYTVHDDRWNKKDGGYEYQVIKEGEKEVYKQMVGNEEVEWVKEKDMELV